MCGWEVRLTAVRWVVVDSDAAAVVTALHRDAAVGPARFWCRPAGTKVLGLDVGVAVVLVVVAADRSYANVLPALSQPVAIVGGGGVREAEKGGCRRALGQRGDRLGAAPGRQLVVHRWDGWGRGWRWSGLGGGRGRGRRWGGLGGGRAGALTGAC